MNKDTLIVSAIAVLLVVVASLFIFGILRLPGSELSQESEGQEVEEQTMTQPQGELQIEEIEEGTGDTVEAGDTVRIHYTGTLENGEVFDSSVERGEPFQTQIGVGQVIEGWDEGVVGMKVGGKRRLIIPPHMAYGDQELPGIPANSTLIFEVELLEIVE